MISYLVDLPTYISQLVLTLAMIKFAATADKAPIRHTTRSDSFNRTNTGSTTSRATPVDEAATAPYIPIVL